MNHGAFLWAATAVALVGAVPARAGDEPTDPVAAALAKARRVEQQLTTAVATICQSSVAVLNWQIPKPPPAKPPAAGEPPAKPPSREPRLAGVGSGVLVTRANKTWILTNVHVVDQAVKLQVVTPDGVAHEVKVEDSIEQYDIALLRFDDAKIPGLKPVPVVGKKSAELDEGQWCVATGNPFELGMDGAPVVTLGVISGLNRVLGGRLLYGRAIQHDAAVNPGNSGGPLWNLKGEFIGINGMIQFDPASLAAGQGASNIGASYSIPVEEIDAFLGQLIDAKKDARAGYLGIATETDTDRTGKPVGARVTNVDAGGPAGSGSKAIQCSDVIDLIIVSSSEKRYAIRTASDLINALSLLPAGTKISISYRRGTAPGRWVGELGAPK